MNPRIEIDSSQIICHYDAKLPPGVGVIEGDVLHLGGRRYRVEYETRTGPGLWHYLGGRIVGGRIVDPFALSTLLSQKSSEVSGVELLGRDAADRGHNLPQSPQ